MLVKYAEFKFSSDTMDCMKLIITEEIVCASLIATLKKMQSQLLSS